VRGVRVCDVGCAYGWFLDVARRYGLEATGIEPEEAVAREGIRRGLKIRVGFFPDVLAPDETFDILVFNDVFEHLPDVQRILDQCFSHLTPRGRLVINLPSSRGVLFRASCLLARLGFPGPFERLWQKHFHCPHLSYFNDANLKALVTAHGFEFVQQWDISALTLRGLWSRLRMDGRVSWPLCALLYLALLAIWPLISLAPSDTSVLVFRKQTRP
jgi:SAM-dependent methyltransferase